jgi:SAM-dependent methyltransferase
MVSGHRYERALEIGCGSGCFTRLLAGVADQVLAQDVAPAAIERARVQTSDLRTSTITFRAADIMYLDLAAGGPWNLVVFSETIYCLGWLYSFFDISWLGKRLFDNTPNGGRLLLANTYGRENDDWLQTRWLIDTYRDLFRNIGFRVEREDSFKGAKDGVDFTVLMTLFERPSAR